MILLDTDHLTVLAFPDHARYSTLTDRMEATDDEEFFISIVSFEEQMRGWLAYVNKFKDVTRQTPAYSRLAELVTLFADWDLLLFDDAAAQEFKRLRKAKVRIGTMDLKIASIALANECLLLTSNLKDFHKVPELNVENWLE